MNNTETTSNKSNKPINSKLTITDYSFITAYFTNFFFTIFYYLIVIRR